MHQELTTPSISLPFCYQEKTFPPKRLFLLTNRQKQTNGQMNERMFYIEFIWPVPLEVQKKNTLNVPYPVTYNNKPRPECTIISGRDLCKMTILPNTLSCWICSMKIACVNQISCLNDSFHLEWSYDGWSYEQLYNFIHDVYTNAHTTQSHAIIWPIHIN